MTVGSAFNLDIERAVFDGLDVTLRPVDIKSTDDLVTGLADVDALATERAAEQGIHVVNVPTYCQSEVSDHTIMLLLALQRNLTTYDSAMRGGVWA